MNLWMREEINVMLAATFTLRWGELPPGDGKLSWITFDVPCKSLKCHSSIWVGLWKQKQKYRLHAEREMADHRRAHTSPVVHLFCESSGWSWSEDTAACVLGGLGRSICRERIQIICCKLPVRLMVRITQGSCSQPGGTQGLLKFKVCKTTNKDIYTVGLHFYIPHILFNSKRIRARGRS